MDINYIRMGDYYIPDLTLPEENRPIGRWGRMHRDYLKEHKPIQYNCLLLSGNLWTYLAGLNEQAQDRLERMIDQMKVSEGITEALKASDPMAWVQRMNNIRARVEEIVREELIYV
ncbi:MAG: TnpV protein [Clostridiales bacterium]|nr:TnpV protein [Clostridiales bacterium]